MKTGGCSRAVSASGCGILARPRGRRSALAVFEEFNLAESLLSLIECFVRSTEILALARKDLIAALHLLDHVCLPAPRNITWAQNTGRREYTFPKSSGYREPGSETAATSRRTPNPAPDCVRTGAGLCGLQSRMLLGLQDVADLAREVLWAEGFLQKSRLLVQDAETDNGVFGV